MAKKIPAHLRQYTVKQNYASYTPINHAVWRYVMRQNHETLKDLAHEAYTDGLKASGISIEQIPDVAEMNEKLGQFGLGAATIDGFIPGVAFFDFQSHGILPVVAEIRKLENIQYTPAPDMLHEAAGHAPILADQTYASYVKRFGEIGKKAIATKEEHDVFEAVRAYSNLLEKGSATGEQLAEAQQEIAAREALVKGESEAELIGRLYWWTVEYGLIGTVENPKIYGAGLLSSVEEGGNILDPKVKKIPYDVEKVVRTGFDITKPQPQLFVCRTFEELMEGLEEFADTMAFRKGGAESVDKAAASGNTATIEFSSGLQVSGIWNESRKDAEGNVIYLQSKAPTALAYGEVELPEHSKTVHADGYGTPAGRLADGTALEELSVEEIKALGLKEGEDTELRFASGITVSGKVEKVLFRDGRPILVQWKNTLVTNGEIRLFEPEWGDYDMAVGAEVVSVYAGAADGEAYYGEDLPAQSDLAHEQDETMLDSLYGRVREVRNQMPADTVRQLVNIYEELKEYPDDWLLRLEIVEILEEVRGADDFLQLIKNELETLQETKKEYRKLIANGLKAAEKISLKK
ncbi:aromatic amino acid hydroxylase [Alkalicoccus halolimnae]|uniref:Aromatic amino acid hydroxylase n=1 Tax=Alkalicoccus halolimnae TaxID=1667239 RepID=A0A5C7F439_9BACI|nr:aromatic amino acid hydroxylase [Alkalicoccus halolimnae]TXF85352.1 aromatic amino acid hydroxylase [Alkalicoccus halolimnae]